MDPPSGPLAQQATALLSQQSQSSPDPPVDLASDHSLIASSSQPNAWQIRASQLLQALPVKSVSTAGVISVTVPPEVLQASPPLWRSMVLGHFVGEAPPFAKVHGVINRLWCSQPATNVVPTGRRNPQIDVHQINASAFLFRIPDETTRSRVLHRQFWHVGDTPLVVQPWSPESASSPPALTALPLWVDFKQVPELLFSRAGLFYLAKLIGEPVRLHPNTERCLRLDVAHVLVKVNLQQQLPAEL